MNSTTYTPDEAVTSYRQAKDKAAQIAILADIMCMPEADVRKMLTENGIDHRSLPRKAKSKKSESKPDQKEAETAKTACTPQTEADTVIKYLRRLRNKYEQINEERNKVLAEIEELREVLKVQED